MKNVKLILTALLAAGTLASCTYAHTPKTAVIPFKDVKCDAERPNSAHRVNNVEVVKLSCSPADVQQYPFLDSLTQNDLPKGNSYHFGIATITNENLAKPLLAVNITQPLVYGNAGAAHIYTLDDKGAYQQVFQSNTGIVEYSMRCPKQFSFIVSGSLERAYVRWATDSQKFTHLGSYDSLKAIPECDLPTSP